MEPTTSNRPSELLAAVLAGLTGSVAQNVPETPPDVAGVHHAFAGTQLVAVDASAAAKAGWGPDAFTRNSPTTRTTITPIYRSIFMLKPPSHALDIPVHNSPSIYSNVDAVFFKRIRAGLNAFDFLHVRTGFGGTFCQQGRGISCSNAIECGQS